MMTARAETFAHYRILRKLGEGGMGEVYLAEDETLRRKVALKFFSPAFAANDEARARLTREARAAAALNHPNIVTVYEIAEFDGQPYIAMEYIDGESLRHFRASHDLPLSQILDIVMQIMEGLQDAHLHGITHRDIKSDNLLIDKNGRVKILDFGLARLERTTKLTRGAAQLGTADYMSPEQALGKEVDPRSDIFSMGVLLFELLTGQLPFRGDRDVAVVYAILNEPPAPLATYNPNLPPELQTICDRALAKELAARYQETGAMLADLRRVRAALREGEHLPGPVRATKKSKSRFVWPVFVSLGILVIAAGIWLARGDFKLSELSVFGSAVSSSQNSLAVLPFSVRGSDEFAYFADGMVELLSTKLDGAGELRTVDARALLSYVAVKSEVVDPKEGKSIAERFGARFYILGSILQVGRKLYFDAALYDIRHSNEVVAHAVASGEANQSIEIVDDLATQLLIDFEQGANAKSQQLAVLTTHSLPALKAYLEGENQFRAGQYEQALVSFQDAVAADANFALAYYRLSLTADWLTRPDVAREAALQAVRHSARLSEHVRMLLEALLAWQSGQATKAQRLYRTIVGTYVTDLEAWFQLGEVNFHYGPVTGHSISASREAFERVLALEPKHVLSLWHLARIAAVEGKLAELSALVDRIRALQPEGERMSEILALRAFALNDRPAQKKVLAELSQEKDLTLMLAIWTVAVYTRNFAEAIPLAELLQAPTRSPEAQFLGHIILAHLELASGRWHAAQTQLAAAKQLDANAATEYQTLLTMAPFLPKSVAEIHALRDEIARLDSGTVAANVTPTVFFTVHNGLHPIIHAYLLGILDANLGDDAAVEPMIETILSQVQGQPQAANLAHDLDLSVRAQWAISRNRVGEAEGLLAKMYMETWYGLIVSSPFYSRAFERYTRAELLKRLGRNDEAVLCFNSFAEHSVYDLIFLAPSLLQRSEIYENLGQEEEARACLQRFVTLWRDCDLELRPELTAAQTRLARLSATTR